MKKQGDRDLILSLVGTKSDLAEVVEKLPVDEQEVEKFFVDEQKQERQFFFPHVSSKSGDMVQDVILTIAEAFDDRGVKQPRGSVVRDADQEFQNLVGSAMENQNLIKKKDTHVNDAKVEKCKSKFFDFSAVLKVKGRHCYEHSRKTAKQTFVTTKHKSSQVASDIKRGSKRFGDNVKQKTIRLIRHVQKEEPKNMKEVAVPKEPKAAAAETETLDKMQG